MKTIIAKGAISPGDPQEVEVKTSKPKILKGVSVMKTDGVSDLFILQGVADGVIVLGSAIVPGQAGIGAGMLACLPRIAMHVPFSRSIVLRLQNRGTEVRRFEVQLFTEDAA